MLNSLQQKIEVVQGVAEHLVEVMVIDSHPEDIRSAIEKSIFTIRKYPDIEHIRIYPLGRSSADHLAVAIERNLCLCLSDHAPAVTLDIVVNQLSNAMSNLVSSLQ
jgi:hypothetical protein